jgi:predicted secreted protein
MDDVKDVFLKVGEALNLSFNEASSGGYLWEWKAGSDAVRVIAGRSKPLGNGVGALCRRDFTVVADAPGDHELEFTHKRPWEQEADKTLRFVLHVKPKI